MQNCNFDIPIFLLGMPRSGTTWLSQIIESSPEVMVRLSPNYSYKYKNKLDVNSSYDDWLKLLKDVFNSNDDFTTQNWRRDDGDLIYFKNINLAKIKRLAIKDTRFHNIYDSARSIFSNSKTIYIVRNPAASLWSWKKCKEFPADAKFEDEWRYGECRKTDYGEYWGFEDWQKLTSKYLDLSINSPNNVMIIKYVDLISNPYQICNKIFKFLDLNFLSEVKDYIHLSTSTHKPGTYSTFKKKKHDHAWKNSFPSKIYSEIINELTGTKLEEFL